MQIATRGSTQKRINPGLWLVHACCCVPPKMRTRNDRGFCRSDFLAVGFYTLDRVSSITLPYVCLALCANQPPQRPRSPLAILDSSQSIIWRSLVRLLFKSPQLYGKNVMGLGIRSIEGI